LPIATSSGVLSKRTVREDKLKGLQ